MSRKKPKKKKKKKKAKKAKPVSEDSEESEKSEDSDDDSEQGSSGDDESGSNKSPFINFSNFHYGAPNPQPPAPINGYYWYPVPISQGPFNYGSFYSGRYVEKPKKNKKKKKKKKDRKYNSMRHMPNTPPAPGPPPGGMYFQPPQQSYYYQNPPGQHPGNQSQQLNNIPPYPYGNPPPNNFPPAQRPPLNYPQNYPRPPGNGYPPYMPNFKSEHMVKFKGNRAEGNRSNYGDREMPPRFGSDFNIMNSGSMRGSGKKRGGMRPQPGFMYKSTRSMMHSYYQRGGRFDAGEIIESEEEESEESLNKAEL